MAYDLYNADTDPNLIYYNYATTLVQPTVTTNIAGDTTIITTINGNSGGGASGPAITFTGGTTGLDFNATGNTITLTGTLIEASGGTGKSSYTKGDLLVASAATSLNKQAVGANGTVLTADSTQTTGVRWVNPATAELNIVTIDFTDTPYSVTDTNDVILVNANGGVIAVELPDGSTTQQKVYYIKKIDASANVVNINADTGDTVDGNPTEALTAQYQFRGVVPDNATGNWSIVSS